MQALLEKETCFSRIALGTANLVCFAGPGVPHDCEALQGLGFRILPVGPAFAGAVAEAFVCCFWLTV